MDFSKLNWDKEDYRYYAFQNFVTGQEHIDYYSCNKSFKSLLIDKINDKKINASSLYNQFGVRDLLKLNKKFGRL